VASQKPRPAQRRRLQHLGDELQRRQFVAHVEDALRPLGGGGAESEQTAASGGERRLATPARAAQASGMERRGECRHERHEERQVDGTAEPIDAGDRERRAGGAAQEIRRVQPGGMPRQRPQRQGLEGAHGRERRQDEEEQQRPVRREGEPQQHRERQQDRRRQHEQRRGQNRRHALGGAPRRHVGSEAAQAHSQNRDGDDGEAHVVLEERAADARERDLEGERAGAHQEEQPQGLTAPQGASFRDAGRDGHGTAS
jgi:hypothetical protein